VLGRRGLDGLLGGDVVEEEGVTGGTGTGGTDFGEGEGFAWCWC